jgi:hypothetical protein
MDSSDTELVRRVLASVLDRLGRDPASAQATHGYRAAGNNLVLIVLGQSDGPDDRALREPDSLSSSLARREQPSSSIGATHPGLEKFTVSQQCSSGSAPRACFLEPEKVCVNSGACEVRGY